MRVAGLRGGVISALLIVLWGTPLFEEVADLHARRIFAVIIDIYLLSLKKLTGNEKPATRSARLRVLFSSEFM